MDDDVQAIDPPVSHVNGAGFVSLPSTIPDLEANSGIPGNYLKWLLSNLTSNSYF